MGAGVETRLVIEFIEAWCEIHTFIKHFTFFNLCTVQTDHGDEAVLSVVSIFSNVYCKGGEVICYQTSY